MAAARQVNPMQTGLQAGATAGYVVQIMASSVLTTTSLTTYGPCDALKVDVAALVTGVTADGASVTNFPVAAGAWDPTAWRSIASISGAANVWAGWYRQVVVGG